MTELMTELMDLLHRDLQMWQAGAVVADRLAAVAAAASPARGVAPEAEPRAAASGQAIVSQLEETGGGAATDAAAAIDAAAVSTPQRGPLRPKNSSSRRSADAGKGGGPGSASEDDFDEPLSVGAGVGSEAERDVL